MKKYVPYILLFVFLFSISFFTVLIDFENSLFQNLFHVSQVAAAITAPLGLLGIYVQFKNEKNLSEAKIILDLNMQMIQDEDLNKIYERLEKSETGGKEFNEKDKIALANYITFFDPFYTLISQGIMHIEVIDPILAYRFFLAVDNEEVQELLLNKNKKAFQNIFKLKEEWMQYRKRKHIH